MLSMIRSFTDRATADIFNGIRTKAALKRCPAQLWNVAFRKLDQLDSVVTLNDLRVPPGNHLEKLSGNRKGQYSIRINEQYRIVFTWSDTGPDDVEITDYH